jgi:hypothetical protein
MMGLDTVGLLVFMFVLGSIFVGGVWFGIKVVGRRLTKRISNLEKTVKTLGEDLDETDEEVEGLDERLEKVERRAEVAAPGAWKEER